VPLDTRHHHFKRKLRFPKEWAMTEERREELVAQRQAQLEKDAQLQIAGQLVDGEQIIRQVMAQRAAAAVVEEPILVPAKGKFAGKGGNGRRVSVRR
jgi:small subunit ribosomal protein S35